ncbi:MAG: DUF1934 family protein [Clostridia bacterium]|nr:DUF1934 family protein [Clostridia bacterium]
MHKCRITVASSADGQENGLVLSGELQLFGTTATLCYQDGDASVEIAVEKEQTVITRRGDYEMCLTLRKGEICTGTLGIMGSEGQVFTQTHALSYSVSERSLLLSAHYDLLFG